MKKTNYAHVYKEGGKYYTKSLVKGQSVYGETIKEDYYREWMPKRSKLGAALNKNLRVFPFKKNSTVLYLGASSGTTCSHVSDVVSEGMVFSVEIAPRIFYKFVELAKTRHNLYPILASANLPEHYSFVPPVDVVFQDIAQRDQLSIFKKNCKVFLKSDGVGLLVVKSRSINSTMKPKDVFKRVRGELIKEFLVVDERGLQPFEKDHMVFAVKKKKV
jgi:fibrillarin-like pre-rRNA processing protein